MSVANQARVKQIANGILLKTLSDSELEYWTNQLDENKRKKGDFP